MPVGVPETCGEDKSLLLLKEPVWNGSWRIGAVGAFARVGCGLLKDMAIILSIAWEEIKQGENERKRLTMRSWSR